MKILVQEEDQLKLNFHTEGKLHAKDIENMPYVESVLPFQKEDAETIIYNWKGYISLVEYLNVKELQFEDTKGIFNFFAINLAQKAIESPTITSGFNSCISFINAPNLFLA